MGQNHKEFKSKYKFTLVVKYIPKRYQNLTDWQLENQRLVYDFKDGKVKEAHLQMIVQSVKKIMKDGDPCKWVVCFVPASTQWRQYRRYSRLARYIHQQTGCDSDPKIVMPKYDRAPSHKTGRSLQREDILMMEDFDYHRHFILVDDLITTGGSFRTVGDLLMERGALSVRGIVFGMTIHPQTKNQ